MIKTIAKIGNSQGIIFDSALLKLTNLNVGDKVNLEIHSGGTITITPMEESIIDEETAGSSAKRLIDKNSELFRRLS